MNNATKSISQKRNVSLDLIKMVAAFFVVCIHYMFVGEAGVFIKAIARFAVPFFFMVSGFFAYNNTDKKLIKKAVHIAKIYGSSLLLFFAYGFIRELSYKHVANFGEYLSVYVQPKTIFNFLVYNTTYSSAHLWFLPALVYVYLLYWLVKKINCKDSFLFISAGVLLAIRLVMGEIVGNINPDLVALDLPNFIFVGFPFFVFGAEVRKHAEVWKQLPRYTPWLLIAFGVIESIGSVHFLSGQMVYFGTVCLVFALFMLALRYENVEYSGFLVTCSELSTYIYIFHIFVGGMLDTVLRKVFALGTSTWWINAKPLIVFVLTLIFSLLYDTAWKKPKTLL